MSRAATWDLERFRRARAAQGTLAHKDTARMLSRTAFQVARGEYTCAPYS